MTDQPTPPPSPDPRLREAAEAAAGAIMLNSAGTLEAYVEIVIKYVAPVLAAVEAERSFYRHLLSRIATVIEKCDRGGNDRSHWPGSLQIIGDLVDEFDRASDALAGGGEKANERTTPCEP